MLPAAHVHARPRTREAQDARRRDDQRRARAVAHAAGEPAAHVGGLGAVRVALRALDALPRAGLRRALEPLRAARRRGGAARPGHRRERLAQRRPARRSPARTQRQEGLGYGAYPARALWARSQPAHGNRAVRHRPSPGAGPRTCRPWPAAAPPPAPPPSLAPRPPAAPAPRRTALLSPYSRPAPLAGAARALMR